jgi:hypothetical protein
VFSDDATVMGVFGSGYVRHQYSEWLLTTVADLLDDDLAISSAGLLRGGAVAWVEVSVPETIRTPEGVAFRPTLLSTTSFDGSMATTYKPWPDRVVLPVACTLGLEDGAERMRRWKQLGERATPTARRTGRELEVRFHPGPGVRAVRVTAPRRQTRGYRVDRARFRQRLIRRACRSRIS